MGRRGDQGKRVEWSERIRRRQGSGLTVAEFCEWEGVSVASFYNWQKKLGDVKSQRRAMDLVMAESRSLRSQQQASFLPVHVLPSAAAASPPTRIEILLTNGVRVFVPISDFETVEKILAVAGRLSALNDSATNQLCPLAEAATC